MFLKTTFPKAHVEGSVPSFQQNMFSMVKQNWKMNYWTSDGSRISHSVANPSWEGRQLIIWSNEENWVGADVRNFSMQIHHVNHFYKKLNDHKEILSICFFLLNRIVLVKVEQHNALWSVSSSVMLYPRHSAEQMVV